MKHSESLKEISTALIAVQSEIHDVTHDSLNPHFKNKFASLEAHLQLARPLLTKNGLAISQGVDGEKLRTTLLHRSGEYISYEMPLILTKNDMQSLGSAVSYARRYSIGAILGIGSEDDDGNEASGKDKVPTDAPKNHAPKSAAEILNEDAPKLGDTVITFGKHKDKKFSELTVRDLRGYAQSLIDMAKRDGKPLSNAAAQLVKMVDAYSMEVGI